MKMLKNNLLKPHRVLLFLMLLSSSGSLFSANRDSLNFANVSEQEAHQDFMKASEVVEQFNSLSDSLIPIHKNLLAGKGRFSSPGGFEAHILRFTDTSGIYMKNSRYILPGLGVKEVIFPFHVFL